MAHSKPKLFGTLFVHVVPDPANDEKAGCSKPERLSLTVIKFAIAGTGEFVLARERPLSIDLNRKAGTTFVLKAPIGQYRHLHLTIRKRAQDVEASTTLGIDLAVMRNETATLALGVNVGEALRGNLNSLDGVLRVLPPPGDRTVEARIPVTGPTTLSLAVDIRPGSFAMGRRRTDLQGDLPVILGMNAANVQLHVPDGAIAPGTAVVVRVPSPVISPEGSPAPEGLPPLFRRQRAVGPRVEVILSAPPIGLVQLTLPYDEVAMAAAGVTVDDLVVLQLNDARTLYREFKPIGVDHEHRRLTIETRALSSFFACTSGIEISQPSVRRDAAGGATAWSSGAEATIAGRTADERALAAIYDAVSGMALPSAHGWQALGWFDFEGVPLRPRVTHVRVRAEVDGLLPHECEFAIRANPPPKFITQPSRHYGPRVAIGTNDVPLVTAIVGNFRFFGEDLLPPLDGWQRSWNRYGPYVYRPTADGSNWDWRPLLPELHFEEATARLAIGLLSAMTDVPMLSDVSEDRRTLASLAAFVASHPDDPQVASVVQNFLNTAGQVFGLGTLSISPTVPLVSRAGENFVAAFVAATAEGVPVAGASRLRRTLARLYTPFDASETEMRQVNAGRLFFVIGSFEEGIRREVVTDTVWCATIQLRIDPAHGRPVLAAIEPLPDAGDQPQSRLTLFRRGADGAWSREVVSDSAPIVDFDFDFVPSSPGSENDTPVRFIAAVAGRDIDVKSHLRVISHESGGWLATPLEYKSPWNPEVIFDLGLWPRLSIDDSGRGAVVFAFLSAGLVTWLVATVEGEAGGVSIIASSSHQALIGSPLPPTTALLQLDSPVSSSRLSLAHWAASIARADQGALWCVFGNGVLNLARIDLASQESTIQIIDVDRMIGFFPAVDTGRLGTPMIAYKDPWGLGQFSADARDDLFFFSLDQGNVVPPAELPLASPHGRGYFSLAELAPYVRLDCGVLLSEDPKAILASIVLHRPFDIVLIPPEGDDPLTLTRITHAHRGFAAQLGRLRHRPTVLALTIDNRATEEDIESIEIASFTDAIGTVPRSEIPQLNRGVMTATVLSALMQTGTRLSHTFPRVVPRQAGVAWEIVDDDAYSAGLLHIPQTYLLRDNGNELEIRLPPVITVVDRTGSHDADNNRPTPCGLAAEDWDRYAQPLADQLDILLFDLPDVPGRLRLIRARGIRVTQIAPHDPRIPQQGGVRFTIEVPLFVALTADPDATAFSAEPSYIYVTLAPFVQDGCIHWWVRESETRLGHVEVDVAFGFFDWLAVLVALIPGLGFVFLAVDAIADSWATSAVNEQLRPPNTGNLQNLLGQVIQHITDLRGASQPRPLEAAWLRAMAFTTYWRAHDGIRPDPPAQADLNVLPSAVVAFGETVAGGAPVRRNLLITSVGGAPSLLEEVGLVGGGDFRVTSSVTWPVVMLPGATETVTLEFTPLAPPGFRNDRVEVRFNGGRQMSVSLNGLVHAPPEPLMRLRPERVDFGVTNAGAQARREVEVFNDGAASLEIAALQLIAPELPAGMLVLETAAPLSVPPGGSAVVVLRFAPPFGGPTDVQAICQVRSNDPSQPQIDLSITAVVAMGQLLVVPTELMFPETPVAANLPQLPPGLPPTVHRGPTLTTMIHNLGPANLTILGMSLRAIDASGTISPHFTLWLADGSALLPNDRILRSGDSVVIVVEFAAAAPGHHVARLEIRASDPTQMPEAVTAKGVAV